MTDITILLDRSGSMLSVRDDTIGGFNAFLREQQALPGDAALTLVQFDDVDPQEIVYDALAIKSALELTTATFAPRGNTPLLDAFGKAIVRTGERLEKMTATARPDRVVFVVITDGQENASKEYARQQIFDMVTHQRERYAWEFLFLGANQDAIAEAAKYAVPMTHAASYTADSAGVKHAFAGASRNIGSARSGTPMGFTDDERAKATSGRPVKP